MTFYTYSIYIALFVWSIFLVINVGGFILCKHVYYDKFKHRKIFNAETKSKQHRHEFIKGVESTSIFMLSGFFIYFLYENDFTLIQTDFEQWGILWTVFSFFLIHTYHDTYFYWTHRALHDVKFLRKYHVAHHHSKIPTPLAAASFSKVEALIQAGFYITVAMIIPVHVGMLLYFYLFIAYIAAWGHVEFEFWPSSLYRLPYGNTFNSLTHHNLHHYYGKGNYGLYYRFWDELCGTLHPKTYEHFYEVQSKIASSRGKKLSVRRPNPQDNVGLYFEEVENFNEDSSIIMSHQKKFYGIETFDENRLETIPHAHCDGISALKLHHQDCNKNITEYPDLKSRSLKFKFELRFILDLSLELINVLVRLPYRGYGFKNRTEIKEKVYALSFTENETEKLLKKINDLDVSLNFFLLNSIDQIVSNQVLKTKWVIPVWAPKKKTNVKDAEIYNNASFIEYSINKKQNLKENFKNYKKVMKGSNATLWALSFKSLSLALKYPFKFLVWAGLIGLKRTGTISNLGSYKGDFDGSLVFAPPVLKNTPLSVGILIYNGELTITAHSRKNFGPSGDFLQKLLEQMKETSLSV